MNEIKKIYLDMDGVLADFNRALKELCGICPVDQMVSTEEDDERAFTAIRECDHFYRRIEPLPGAKELFCLLYEKYGDRVEILTGVPSARRNIPWAGEDKTIWVREHLSDTVKVNLVRRVEKQNYCFGPEYILIDDFERNIRQWEEQGGTGILFRDAQELIGEFDKRNIDFSKIH